MKNEPFTVQVPHPPRYPIIGNLPQLKGSGIVKELFSLSAKYGPLFEITIPGSRFMVACNHEIVKELCDDTRFEKKVGGALEEIRRFAGDGLFTAHNDEPNWALAHRILLPGFGMKQMIEYVPRMQEVANQLLEKWSVKDSPINVTEDFTRLTLDTIALCGFDYRFNSFQKEELHPFLDAMVRGLTDSLSRVKKTKIQRFFDFKSETQFEADRDLMFRLVDEIIEERLRNREKYSRHVDFLSMMTEGIDKKTNAKLAVENIRYQLITFLIAGHETTSGMLSFATHFLLENKEIYAKAQAEALRVLGEDPDFRAGLKEIAELKYISWVLKESLRLYPTAPLFARSPLQDTLLAGRYQVTKNDRILVLSGRLHRDPAIWEEAEKFDPERFSPGRFNTIPEHAYKPFGTGQRSCIGQHFSMVEATLALGLILKHFELARFGSAKLEIKETLTIKPANLQMTAKLFRPLPRAQGSSQTAHEKSRLHSFEATQQKSAGPMGNETHHTSLAGVQRRANPVQNRRVPSHGTALAILDGSNMGTCSSFADALAEQGARLGFVTSRASLDEASGDLPNSGAVLIVTSTYNGLPPDNAKNFAAWISSADFHAPALQFAVFGVGDSNWKTYQEFPRFVDERLACTGGRRVLARAEANVAENFDGDCEKFATRFWESLTQHFELNIDVESVLADQEKLFEIEVSQDQELEPLHARYGAYACKVLVNRELQKVGGDSGSERSTSHIELELPEGVSYRIGDHFGVIAKNRDYLVRKVCHRLGYSAETLITLHKKTHKSTFYPVGQSVTLGKVLAEYTELQDVVTRRQLLRLLPYFMLATEEEVLKSWTEDSAQGREQFIREVLEKRRSLFDVLTLFPSCLPSLELILELLNPLRPRFYSISSSALLNPKKLSLTVAVVSGNALSENGTFKGVCSSFLQTREMGDVVFGFVKSPAVPFVLPENPEVPVIMIGPGTGVAPFRGFLEERQFLANKGTQLGKAVLYFGCRRPEHDFIYQAELEHYQRNKIVELHVAFSHVEKSEFPFVQQLLVKNSAQVFADIAAGAHVYVCGDGLFMAPQVRENLVNIVADEGNMSHAAAENYVLALENEKRYVVDVFGQKST